MDDLIDDIEAGIAYIPPRQSNKKMKKRKQLDALLKFRSKKRSNELLRSSEDELFLPNQKTTPRRRYRNWCSYTRHILSFCLVCIFMIVCAGLAYANIELKNEVHNLSSRVTEIEKSFSNFEINRVISTIDQIKSRLNLIERWNVSYIYDRLQKLQGDLHQINKNSPANEMSMNGDDVDVSSKLNTIEQKSTQFSEVAKELDKLSRDADDQATHVINEKTKSFDKSIIENILEQERKDSTHQSTNQLEKTILSLNESLYANTIKWNEDLKTLRNEFQSLKAPELALHFQELTNLVQNSSDKTSAIVTALQTNIDKLRTLVESCNCSKEPVYLKPSIVDTHQLQQSLVTKPNPSDKSDHNNTIDVAQVVNPPSIPT